jgi:ABC-type multidrug transport system fused ATPase/permease subunit
MAILKRFLFFLKPYKRVIVIDFLFLLGMIGLELVVPLVQRTIVDEVLGIRDYNRLGLLIAGLIGLYAFQQLANSGDQYIRHVLGGQFILDLRVHIYAYLQKLSLSFFERTSTGELMSRVTNDVSVMEQFATHGITLLAVDILRLSGAVIALLFLNWQLALLVFIPIPIIAVILRVFNQRIRPVYTKMRARLGDINARLQDNLSGMRVIQLFAQEGETLHDFKTDSENYFKAQVQGIFTWSTFFPGIQFLSSLGTVIVLGVGGILVIQERMTLGVLVAFISYLAFLYAPINRIVDMDNIFQQAIAAGERILELMDATPEIVDAPDATELPALSGEVRFRDVHFAYNSGDEVLKHVDFRMAPDEVVALVGPSGAGKTSIANLICRFYDPVGGEITIDGHDLRHVKINSLRKQIAVVLQDTFLFNTTIRQNLMFARPDASEDDLIAAAKTAHIHEFIETLPKGYETEIGERGVRLSGGQKQRLALARAVLANPRILILDEATSSVDAETEYLIQQALESVLKGRTALVIAHRLSTIRSANKIIALENGEINEVGSHEELMSNKGLYSQLYRRQLELATAGENED